MEVKNKFRRWLDQVMTFALSLTKDFYHDEKGGIAVIAGVTLIPLLTFSSVGIELTRVSHAQTKVAYAADAAALAAARYKTEDAEENALKFFNANFDRDRFNVTLETNLEISEDKKNFILRVNGDIATYFSEVLGISSVPFEISSVIERQLGGVEVALVLDNSGSMSGSKMTSLKNASNALITKLFEGLDDLDSIALSIVPYSSSVAVDPTVSEYQSWMRDVWPFNGNNRKWAGCLEVRQVQSLRRNDSPPSASDDTKFFHYNYRKGVLFGGGFLSPNRYCPLKMMPLSNNDDDLKSHINNMVASGSTVGPFGLVWGWRMISPRWQGKWTGVEAKDYEAPDNRKAIVMMTDGENSADTNYTAYYSIVGTNGISKSVLDNEMAQICKKIKKKNIEIYTVTFKLNSDSTKKLYRNCATRPANYFDAETDADLEGMFTKIAESIKVIRIKS